jgi:hypothetical protein
MKMDVSLGLTVILNAVKDLLHVFDQGEAGFTAEAQSTQRFLISNSSLRVLRACGEYPNLLYRRARNCAIQSKGAGISATGGSASLTSRPSLS